MAKGAGAPNYICRRVSFSRRDEWGRAVVVAVRRAAERYTPQEENVTIRATQTGACGR